MMIDSATRIPRFRRYIPKMFPILLKAVLQSGDMDLILETVQKVSEELGSFGMSTPYGVAAEYLSSNRDPAVLERQQPEMREAVMLLVNLSDETVADTNLTRA